MDLEKLFYRGQYRQILALTIDAVDGEMTGAHAAFVIASLTFQGRLDEAEAVHRLFVGKMSFEHQVMARFFLGVGFVRHSRNDRGRYYFLQNARHGLRAPEARVRFYVWQGIGFYRLTCCRYADALRHAARALTAAIEANFLYGKALASDLMAHSQVGPGQVQLAGENFRRALAYAKQLGDGGLCEAIEVSRVIHSAEHGLDPHHDLTNLETLLATMQAEDSYSRARVLLEIGRQRLLRGDREAAIVALDDARRMVFASQHRRYSVLLNLRYAYVQYLAGDYEQALSLVTTAAETLDPILDHGIVAEVLGLEWRILGARGMVPYEAKRQAVQARLHEATKRNQRLVSRRIMDRDTFRSHSQVTMVGDDPLGDLVDMSYSRGDLAIARLINSGYLLLMMNKLGLEPGQSVIVVDVTPGGIFIFDRGFCQLITTGVSSLIRRILACLARGTVVSKDELIREVWQLTYHALKHDHLIYTSMRRVRQLLGQKADWLEATESGYALRAGVNVRFHANALLVSQDDDEEEAKAVSEASLTHGPADKPGAEVLSAMSMNQRQLKIMEYLTKHEFIDAKTYGTWHGISAASARRDLVELMNKGLLTRYGKGRATSYRMSGPSVLS